MREMGVENVKHTGSEAYRKKMEFARRVINSALDVAIAVGDESHLGVMNRLADQAYEIIKQKGEFTSHDCADMGLFDTTQRKRLFTALKLRHPDIKPGVRSRWGDKRKIYRAWIDDKKFEETQKNPDQEIKDFVEKNNPTTKGVMAKPLQSKILLQKADGGSGNLLELNEAEYSKIEAVIVEGKKELVF